MGCPKHLYNPDQESSPFLRVWKKERLENVDVHFLGTPEEKSRAEKFCYSYLPFGLGFNHSADSPENQYKYNGKEEQPETNLYDFSARMYDPALGRFMQLDPLTETRSDWTPYRFAYNNPLKFTDPSGMIEVSVNGEKVKGKLKRAYIRGVKNLIKSSKSSSESSDSDNNGFDDSEQSDVVDNPEIAPTASGRNGGRFGNTRTNRNGTPRFHDGTDIKASKGTAIRSILPGKVLWTRETFYPGQYGSNSYGNIVAVESIDAHGNRIVLYYNHLDVSVSYKDRQVGSGEVLGYAGNTGNAGFKGKRIGTRNGRAVYDGNFTSFENGAIAERNNHVHIKARRNGQRVDPEIYMSTKFNRHGISKTAISNMLKRMGF